MRYHVLLYVILAILPLLMLCGYVRELGVDVPFQDQWAAMIPLLQKSSAGDVTITDYWHMHNEHRLPLAKKLLLSLAERTGWNVRVELAANILIASAGFVVLAGSRVGHARRVGRPLIDWTLPASSLIFFSPAQWENWLWGWQVAVHLCIVFLLGFLVMLATPPRAIWARGMAAVVFAVLASCSYGAGLIVWCVGAGVLLARALRALGRAWLLLALWIAASALFLRTYFAGDGTPWGAAPNFSYQSMREAVRYFLRFIASPVCYLWPEWSELAGILLLGLFAWAIWSTGRGHGGARPPHTFEILMGLSSVGVAALTTLGRYEHGVDQAFESRYLAFSSLLLIAVLRLLADVRSGLKPQGGRRQSLLPRPAVAVIVPVLLLMFSLNARARLRDGLKHSLRMQRAREELLSTTPDYSKIAVYPDPQGLRIMTGMLRRWGLSVFRPSDP